MHDREAEAVVTAPVARDSMAGEVEERWVVGDEAAVPGGGLGPWAEVQSFPDVLDDLDDVLPDELYNERHHPGFGANKQVPQAPLTDIPVVVPGEVAPADDIVERGVPE